MKFSNVFLAIGALSAGSYALGNNGKDFHYQSALEVTFQNFLMKNPKQEWEYLSACSKNGVSKRSWAYWTGESEKALRQDQANVAALIDAYKNSQSGDCVRQVMQNPDMDPDASHPCPNETKTYWSTIESFENVLFHAYAAGGKCQNYVESIIPGGVETVPYFSAWIRPLVAAAVISVVGRVIYNWIYSQGNARAASAKNEPVQNKRKRHD